MCRLVSQTLSYFDYCCQTSVTAACGEFAGRVERVLALEPSYVEPYCCNLAVYLSGSHPHPPKVYQGCQDGNPIVLADVRRLLGKDTTFVPSSAEEICQELFHTCYMATSNSSDTTHQLAQQLATQVPRR